MEDALRSFSVRCTVLAVAFLGAATLLALFAMGVSASASPTLPLPPSPRLPCSSTACWRIGITADGLYRFSYETLAAARVPVTEAAPSALHLLWRGQGVALQEVGTEDGSFDLGDSLLFYAEKFHGPVQDEKYTDENVYWLSVDDSAPGLRMGSRSVAPDGSAERLTWYTETVRAEENHTYWARWSTTPGTDATWFWEEMKAASPTTHTRAITLTALAPGVHDATLTAQLAGRSQNAHRLRFSVNGAAVGETSWTGKVGHVATLPVPSPSIREGANTLDITVLTDGGPQRIYLNWFEIVYRRRPVAHEDALFLSSPFSGTIAITLTGFSTDAVHLYDITDPLAPTRLVSATSALSGTNYALAMQDTAPAGSAYLAAAHEAVRDAPAPVRYSPPGQLITSAVGADQIIVAPGEFITAVQPLADRRRAQGLRVRLVDVEDVYALFNDGIFHPEAIRSFVAHAYANWPSPPPSYLLLVGDGNFNFKGYNPAEYGEPSPVWVPPYLEFADPWQGEVAVDSRYGDVDADGMPELYVGRIPAASVEEAEAVVGKILGYESKAAPPWRDRMLFVADNVPDEAGDFQGAVERLQGLTPAWMEGHRIYLTDYCGPPVSPPGPCPSATLALTETWSAGAAMVTYAGHGSLNRWTHERLLIPDHIPSLQADHGLPFVLSLDCLDGYWMFPPSYPKLGTDTRSLAEALLLTPRRGAAAVFAPAGLGTIQQEEQMARAMFQAMFDEGILRLGPLTQAGREAVSGSHLARTYTLLGDPAMRLAVLPQRVCLPVVLR